MNAQQLKNSILQMAIQGKLVPQDPSDEPASVLLERICKEKEQLIKAGKIKRDKHESVICRKGSSYYETVDGVEHCVDEEIPFEIPDSWVWARHNDLFEFSGGSQPPKSKFSYIEKPGHVRLYQIRDYGETPVPVYIPEKTVSKFTEEGDILLARYGASLGKVFFAHKGAYNVALAKIIPLFTTPLINKKYIFYYYQSILYQQFAKNNSRSAQAGFNKEDLSVLLFPLPPIREQQRVVEKIEGLLGLVEKYGKSETLLNEIQTKLPEQLKKSVLQIAVQGKLVAQDPTDEPASILLERIHTEKEQLIKAGKIKRDKHESVICRKGSSYYETVDGVDRCIDEEVPFDIPDSWEWVRLGNLFWHNTGKALNASDRSGQLLEYITTSNLYWNKFKLDILKKMYFTDSEIERCTATKGDLLVCEGGDIGRAAIWDFNYDIRIQNHIHRLRAYMPLYTEYYYYIFYLYKHAGWIGGRGVAIQGLSSKAIHSLLIPLPPAKEQGRIVKKIKEFLPFIESLKCAD